LLALPGLLAQNIQGYDKRDKNNLQEKYPIQFPVERLACNMIVVGIIWHLDSFNFCVSTVL